MGVMPQDRNAAGGAVPARAADITRDCLRAVWNDQDWRWQTDIGTLAIAAGVTTATLPDDFRKQCSAAIKDVDQSQRLRFTSDVSRFQVLDSQHKSTDRGHPLLGIIIHDASEESDWKVQFTPASDAAYSMRFAYQRRCPVDLPVAHAAHRADDEEVVMPAGFQELWKLRAKWKLLDAFQRNDADAINRARRDYRAAETAALDEHNETLTESLLPIADGYGDRDAFLAPALSSDGSRLPFDVLS